MKNIAGPAKAQIVATLLEEHGRTYANELGINVEQNTPSPLFRLLCASLLFSARISADTAVAAARALADKGWTTAQKMADSTWRERTDTLNRAGYARYDESTSRYLGETSALILDRWDGDLRNLREEAEHDPQAERRLLKECKGIGDVGVDIFFREVQVAWEELVPFADKRALQTAKSLDLADDAPGLIKLVDDNDFAGLVAALVRVGLGKRQDEVLEHAASR
ncbi:MAG: hypothetical protein WD208_00750 [Dehalococcoidia bacterium]